MRAISSMILPAPHSLLMRLELMMVVISVCLLRPPHLMQRFIMAILRIHYFFTHFIFPLKELKIIILFIFF